MRTAMLSELMAVSETWSIQDGPYVYSRVRVLPWQKGRCLWLLLCIRRLVEAKCQAVTRYLLRHFVCGQREEDRPCEWKRGSVGGGCALCMGGWRVDDGVPMHEWIDGCPYPRPTTLFPHVTQSTGLTVWVEGAKRISLGRLALVDGLFAYGQGVSLYRYLESLELVGECYTRGFTLGVIRFEIRLSQNLEGAIRICPLLPDNPMLCCARGSKNATRVSPFLISLLVIVPAIGPENRRCYMRDPISEPVHCLSFFAALLPLRHPTDR